MQTFRVYLVRHGQSMFQSLKIVSGTNEFGLSGLGVVQSKKVGSILQSINFESAYVSDLMRCVQSYEHIESSLKFKPTQVTFTPVLREVDHKENILKSIQEVKEQNKGVVQQQNQEEIIIRVENFFTQLIQNQLYRKSYQFINNYKNSFSQYNECGNLSYAQLPIQHFSSYQKQQSRNNILILSHAGFIVESINYLRKFNNLQRNSFQQQIYPKNGAVYILDFNVNNEQDWDCQFSLMNYTKKLNTPFDSIE